MGKTQPEWYNFQEQICEYFKSLGFDATSNVTVDGARTNHAIDVLVKTKFMGQELIWIIEAKKWNSKVKKLQVLGLRMIASDVGVDRGFIISELGFQKGAIEAAIKSNITLTTFKELKIITQAFIEEDILKQHEERIALIYRRY
ncbi:restriction endonuclease [Mucilaginibacter galii]|nr:restriction endonuclease [Mucilaginibacter galii]